MSDKCGFYGYIAWDTHFTNQAWEVGDKKELPCLFGNAIFTLVKRTEDELFWESGDIITSFKKDGDGWLWDHILIDKKAVALVSLV